MEKQAKSISALQISGSKFWDRLETITIITTLIISSLVMIRWFFDWRDILQYYPGGATMKFNTSLVFFLSGFNLLLRKREDTISKYISHLLAILSISLGLFSFIEYFGFENYDFDNLFVLDTYSAENPGRMSPSTALCAILLGLAFTGFRSNKRFFRQIADWSSVFVFLVGLTSLISYLLKIEAGNKTIFFKSMALHTALLYLAFSITLLFKNNSFGFFQFLHTDFHGSKLFKRLLWSVMVLPVVLSYLLLYLVNDNYISFDFGIVSLASTIIPLGLLYLGYLAYDMNKTDIAKKELELELIDNNHYLDQFKKALDNISIIMITDGEGRIIEVNDAFCKITQYTREEIIGQNPSFIDSGHHKKKFFKNLWETILAGDIWSGEIKNQAKDGSNYWVHCSIVPFKQDNEKPYRFMSINFNISQRKNKEVLIQEKYIQQLEHKNKELEQFAYIASHDLQEPLRTIKAYTDLLINRNLVEKNEINQKSFQFIEEAVDRMQQLIKSLLDYNYIDKESELSSVNLNELLQDIENDMHQVLSEKNAIVTYSNLPVVVGFATPLRMLFQNLISNGVKFQKEGKKPIIEINAKSLGNDWQFSVKDNGIGIAEEYQGRIFGLFQRLHNRSEYKGSGIGLTHCRKIVERHSGKIWLESEEGEGTTFYFTIPKKEISKKVLDPYAFSRT